jgi:hypothetical protein
MESKGSFAYSKCVIEELRGKTEGLVGGIEEGLGVMRVGGGRGVERNVGEVSLAVRRCRWTKDEKNCVDFSCIVQSPGIAPSCVDETLNILLIIIRAQLHSCVGLIVI